MRKADALPKDIVFVIDRSGSMEGEKIVQARDALQFILGQLNPDDRFSIVGFDDLLSVFSDTNCNRWNAVRWPTPGAS